MGKVLVWSGLDKYPEGKNKKKKEKQLREQNREYTREG